MASLVAVSMAPSLANAASSAKKQQQKAKKAAKQFNRAVNRGAPVAKVIAAARRLARLQPTRSVLILKKAGQTLPPATTKQAEASLTKVLNMLLDNPNIPEKTKNKLEDLFNDLLDRFPTPTPTPYQA